MRKIFTSQRVENAEGVAALLREAGIEVRITNGRSYQSRRRGQFSYLDKKDDSQLPTVWVVRADDQPRAREILRDARLLDTTRRDHPVAEYAFRAGTGQRWPQLGLAHPHRAAAGDRRRRAGGHAAPPRRTAGRTDARTGAAGATGPRPGQRGRLPGTHPTQPTGPGPNASRTGNATEALTGRRAVTSAGGLRPVLQTTGSRP